ncbi:MAG: pyrroline-5-carboxylate reductase [Oscillospiraceae bacterium]|nr:pyrroline-5-carboxylate reductase [Oscillospiraceae bacterium]
MNVGFIGAGNMGGAIAMAVRKSVPHAKIYVAEHNADKAQRLIDTVGAVACDVQNIAEICDFVFLGVKPQTIRTLLEEISNISSRKEDAVYISMAAGVTLETLCGYLGASPVIRIMPNTPVAVGEGMTLYACSCGVSPAQEKDFLSLMAQSGKVDSLDEALIDAGCAVAGCGPAFAFLFAEALAKGGIACGLTEEKAISYAAQMLYGSAKLLMESEKNARQLREAVCSPGGSTIRGVQSLEEHGFGEITANAVQKSFERTKELG